MLQQAPHNAGPPLRAEPLDAEAVHRQIVSAWQARDWNRLRSLLHPDGTFESTAAGGRVVDADDLVSSLVAAERAGFSVSGLTYEKLSEDFVLAFGYVPQPLKRGRSLSRVAWLVEVRDGLAYQSTPFRTRASALAVFTRLAVLRERRELASAVHDVAGRAAAAGRMPAR
jgi:hypothetical protein